MASRLGVKHHSLANLGSYILVIVLHRGDSSDGKGAGRLVKDAGDGLARRRTVSPHRASPARRQLIGMFRSRCVFNSRHMRHPNDGLGGGCSRHFVTNFASLKSI